MKQPFNQTLKEEIYDETLQNQSKILTSEEIKEMFYYIESDNSLLLQDFLSKRPNIDLLEIEDDEKSLSIMHQAAYSNSLHCAQVLINYIVSTFLSKPI